MRPLYLWHVALGAGLGTRETREHLDDATLTIFGDHLNRAMAGPSGDPIPGHGDYRLAAQVIAGALLCVVGHGRSMDGLVTFSIVTRSRDRVKAWVALHEGYPEFAGSRGDVPQVPYCAVRVEQGLARHIAAGEWLDAYQVVVAWAWIISIRTPARGRP